MLESAGQSMTCPREKSYVVMCPTTATLADRAYPHLGFP